MTLRLRGELRSDSGCSEPPGSICHTTEESLATTAPVLRRVFALTWGAWLKTIVAMQQMRLRGTAYGRGAGIPPRRDFNTVKQNEACWKRARQALKLLWARFVVGGSLADFRSVGQ